MSSKPRLGRANALILWVVAALAAHVGLPALLARRGPRLGWVGGRPSRLNVLGLVPVAVGASGLAWCYGSHRASAPEETVQISLVPEYLVASGPYRLSRNPMYVTEQLMWLGWSLFFGSPVVGGSTVALAAAMRQAVDREENTLERQFGSSWLDYADRIPRWL